MLSRRTFLNAVGAGLVGTTFPAREPERSVVKKKDIVTTEWRERSPLFYLPPNPNVVYSAALMSKVEEMFLTGKMSHPIERTLLTTGLVAAGMESLASGQKRLETPHLAIRSRRGASRSSGRVERSPRD